MSPAFPPAGPRVCGERSRKEEEGRPARAVAGAQAGGLPAHDAHERSPIASLQRSKGLCIARPGPGPGYRLRRENLFETLSARPPACSNWSQVR